MAASVSGLAAGSPFDISRAALLRRRPEPAVPFTRGGPQAYAEAPRPLHPGTGDGHKGAMGQCQVGAYRFHDCPTLRERALPQSSPTGDMNGEYP